MDESLVNDSTYLDASRYALQLEQYLDRFRRDQLLVLPSEELRQGRRRCLSRAYAFLGDDGWEPPNVEEEFQRSSELRRRRPVDSTLRKVPGHRGLARVATASLKTLKRWVTTTKAPERPSLSEPGRSELGRRLRDDVRRLRRLLDLDFDGWGIA